MRNRIAFILIVCVATSMAGGHGVGAALPDAVPASAATPTPPPVTGLDGASIDRITGARGTWNEVEGVYKVTFPRTDVAVTIDGWDLPPFMGLTSWAAFQPTAGGQAMMMGDLALFQDEVNPVLSALLDNGAEVTALHNHFLFDRPRVFFMHLGGSGSAATLAGAVRAALDRIREIRAAAATPPDLSGRPPLPKVSSLDGISLEKILGVPGQSSRGMFKAVFGREVTHHGRRAGKEMGVST
ncbi:MAG TPA: DUF1259 domain-containing protein, partial [Candidatus Polarisedimenticolia bacterium]|nr:DUF1259 domain-containing protein [Candidatus Polarisedimenticolia bacterium]